MARRTLSGCRTILTGASSGIGRALAVELARGGARLVLVARRAERLEELAASLPNAQARFEVVAGDIATAETRRSAIERAQTAFGGLDLLINNAGIGAMGHFAEATDERLRQVMEVNFFAPAETIRLALPLLRAGNRPMVCNIGSILGHRGVPSCSEYCASKFALQGLSESLRAELAGSGIDLLMVSPARTRTEFFDSAINAPATRWPLLRGIPAETVARRIVRAIRAGRHEIVPSFSGKLLLWANRLFPWAVDRALAERRAD